MKRVCAYTFIGLLALSANGRDRVPEISWGVASNECRIGIRVQSDFVSGTEASKQTGLYLATTNQSKKDTYFRPDRMQCFRATLRDSSGNEVGKTRLGKRFGKAVKDVLRADERPRFGPQCPWVLLMVPQPWDVEVVYFNLMEHFNVIEAGDYDLTIELRLYQQNSKGEFCLLKPPPHTVKVRIDR